MDVRRIVVAIMALGMMAAGCGGPRQWQTLITSNPAGAVVKIDGAEVGHTPVSLQFEGKTTILVEQRGYESQDVLITARTGPNLVVDLVRIEVPEAESAGFTTMRQIEAAFNEGGISRVQYDQFKAEIRARRAIELERAKRQFRDGRMSEKKYKERVREIKEEYEG